MQWSKLYQYFNNTVRTVVENVVVNVPYKKIHFPLPLYIIALISVSKLQSM